MNSLPPGLQRAARRARWLAELAAALDSASRVLPVMRDQYGANAEIAALRDDIARLSGAIASLRRGQGHGAEEIDPIWIN